MARKRIQLLLVMSLLGILKSKIGSLAIECGEGTFVVYSSSKGSDICLPCANDTYMPYENHTDRTCYPCTRVTDDTTEILISPCNHTTDAIILCSQTDYFRTTGPPRICKKCRQCLVNETLAQNCTHHSDAICCKRNAVWDKESKACKVYCGKGYRYDAALDECKLCDDESYMDKDQHTNTRCKPCPYIHASYDQYLTNETVCTRDAPPLIVCLRSDHFYKYPELDHREGDCIACKLCEYSEHKHTGRTCSYYSDTVCCPDSDMDVVDTDEGPQCVNRTISSTSVRHSIMETTPPSQATSPRASNVSTSGLMLCGEHQFYQANSSSCQRCPSGTFLNQTEHRQTKCLNCTNGLDPVPKPCKFNQIPQKLSVPLKGFVIVIVGAFLTVLTLGLCVIIVINGCVRRVCEFFSRILSLSCFTRPKSRRTSNSNDNDIELGQNRRCLANDTNADPHEGQPLMNSGTDNEAPASAADEISNEDQTTLSGDSNREDQNTVGGDTNSEGQNTMDGDTSNDDQNTVGGDANTEDQNTVGCDTNSEDQNTVGGDTNSEGQNTMDGDTSNEDQNTVGGDANTEDQNTVGCDTNSEDQNTVGGGDTNNED